jgi:hypothetical protein
LSGNHHDIDGKASALLAIQIIRNRKVPDDVVLLIERIEEPSTFQGVVALRPQLFVYSQLAAHDEHRAALRFHCLERLEGDRLINLRRASSIAR